MAVPIGGWDLVYICPRTMYRAVPAGSVYFLECLAGNIEDVFDLFHGTTMLQQCSQEVELREFAKIGSGLTLVGTWQSAPEV